MASQGQYRPIRPTRNPARLNESAVMLLLRSPRLPVSLILELLEIGDAEFRQMSRENRRIAELLEARRDGTLKLDAAETATCPTCGQLFSPYAGARHCSDECRDIHRISRTRPQRRRRMV